MDNLIVSVMILKFFVDFLLLLGTNRLAGFTPGWRRSGAAAAIGALFSGVCVSGAYSLLSHGVWRALITIVMVVTAFGWNSSAVKRGGIYLLLSFALEGAASGMGKDQNWKLLAACGCICLLCYLGLGGIGSGRTYVPLCISHGDTTVSVIALRDTGNTLRDPVTGQQVLVVGAEIATKLTGLTVEQLRAPLETLAQKPLAGLRLIPYRTIGQSGGLLLAMRFENVRIGTKSTSAIVAFAPETVGEGDCYRALTGGNL